MPGPDLSTVLSGLAGDGGGRMLTATVDAVGEGVCTISYNGGQFDNVPYLRNGPDFNGFPPMIGQQVYVFSQPGWGSFILGSPATSAERLIDPGAEVIWEPTAVAHYVGATGSWSTPVDSILRPNNGTKKGLWFYPQPFTLPFTEFASFSFWLAVGDVTWADGIARDTTYLDLFLHNNASASDTFTGETDDEDVVTVQAWHNSQQYVSLPFTWLNRLLAGTAKGIGVQGWRDPEVQVEMLGQIRVTKL